MGLGDRFKDLRKQTQDAMAERKEGIQHAVDVVGAAANQRTKGKYADRIANVGERLNAKVEKFAGDAGGEQGAAGQAATETTFEETSASATAQTPAEEAAQPSSAPPDFE